MTDPAKTNSIATVNEPKFTAEQIEKKCPEHLRKIGKQIAARLEKIDKQIVQAENHSISVNQLIAEAKTLCDEGGFNAFREKFFPNLGKSRVYELLAIGTGKKTVEEARASNRKRQAKHRANKAEASNSVTVTENGLANAPTSRCPVSAGHWCSRSTRAATGFADRKNRRRCWSPT